MKLKKCQGNCELELPLAAFTSTRAKRCKSCTTIHKMEQQKASRQKQIERLKNKKPKTKTVKSIADLKKQAQRVFNAWIRKRDEDDPCISCQGNCGKWDAGHFWAMGSKGALRYHEDNCHKQGVGCNRFKHGNLLEYRINLIKKIGQDRVDWLDEHRNDTHKFTREELLSIIERYKS
jgi:hypothetical protein